MRFYKIEIRNPKTGALVQPSYFRNVNFPATWASFIDGKNLSSALNIQLDIPVSTYAQPRQGAFLRIWGTSIQELSQSFKVDGFNILIYGGMQKGLPLAKPQQSGLIMQGTIFQAFGNWIGTDQTLDMTLLPPMGLNAVPAKIVFNWMPGQTMGDAIQVALNAAFNSSNSATKFTISVKTSDKLVMPGRTQPAFYNTLNEFATAVFNLSQSSQFSGIKPLSGGAYAGVSIVVRGTTILVFDGTQDYGRATFDTPTQILFEDMVGQPTWISPTSLNFKCVMRADIQVGDYVQMPKMLASPYAITTPGAAFPNVPARNNSIFQGKFVVQDVHHFGNFRQPDAASWVTTYDAVAVGSPPPAAVGTGTGTAP